MFDVVVAGAGLAGASLALRLARAGARVALVDAARFPRNKLCGEFLSPESWGVLQRLGVADEIERSAFEQVRRIRLTTPRGRVIDAEIARRDEPPGIGLSRWALDSLIVQRAREAGAELLEGVRVVAPLLREGRVVGLSARMPDARPIEICAQVVVAANGSHSALVHRTGATRVRSGFRPSLFGLKRHIVVNDALEMMPPGTVGLHMVPGGYGGLCRIEGALTNFCALLPDSVLRMHRGDLDRVAEAVCDRNPALRHIWSTSTPSSDWKTVSGVRVEHSSPRLPGILYAGDCQGTVDPLGGQGMTMALLGAELLAPFVQRALIEGTAFAPLQRAYEAAWHARFRRRIRLCRAFHHALVNPAAIDLAASFRPVARQLLAACYRTTRDHNLT